MTGISGVHMWMEDWLINGPSYDKKYQKNFLKVKALWNECVSAFKKCNTIKECNDTYSKYNIAVEKLREEMYQEFGLKKVPIGISDCLDYFEEAVGDLEDKYLQKITDAESFRVTLPEGYVDYIKDLMRLGKHKPEEMGRVLGYPDVKFYIEGDNAYAKGEFWDVRSFCEEHFTKALMDEIMDTGVIDNGKK